MRIVFAIVAVLIAAGAASAQAQPRFSLHETENGFVRLDGETGFVSECLREGGALRCRTAPDERAALQEEIDRLAEENARLRAGLAVNGGDALVYDDKALPDDAEFERALDLMERFMRRFRDVAEGFSRQ
ncbi:MAG: hypothetical protein EA385_15530 [Salinarimonadaceae bacterium]|nr:MAG: hypothetical protein EA385_15530 [Salinarimonadaceae bacterium]